MDIPCCSAKMGTSGLAKEIFLTKLQTVIRSITSTKTFCFLVFMYESYVDVVYNSHL